jgi:hypothetical protein
MRGFGANLESWLVPLGEDFKERRVSVTLGYEDRRGGDRIGMRLAGHAAASPLPWRAALVVERATRPGVAIYASDADGARCVAGAVVERRESLSGLRSKERDLLTRIYGLAVSLADGFVSIGERCAKAPVGALGQLYPDVQPMAGLCLPATRRGSVDQRSSACCAAAVGSADDWWLLSLHDGVFVPPPVRARSVARALTGAGLSAAMVGLSAASLADALSSAVSGGFAGAGDRGDAGESSPEMPIDPVPTQGPLSDALNPSGEPRSDSTVGNAEPGLDVDPVDGVELALGVSEVAGGVVGEGGCGLGDWVPCDGCDCSP